MRLQLAGILTAVLAALTRVVEYSVARFTDAVAQGGGAAGWFPHLETAGRTIAFYSATSRAVVFLCSVPLVAALGFTVGRRRDAANEYRPVIETFAVGGGLGALAGLLAVGAVGGDSILAGVQTVTGAVTVVGIVAATAVQFALLGLAGAALATFGVGPNVDRPSRDPSNAEADSRPE